MTVQTSDYIRWGCILPFFLFHISVTIFIFVKILKNKFPYNSTFFKLYLLVSIADIMNVIVPFLGMKLLLIDDLKPWFQANLWYNRTNFWLSGFFFYNQCILHTAITINRAWTAFTFYKSSSVLSKIGSTVIWFLPIIPALILIPRYGASAIYFTGADNEIHPKYEDPEMQVYTSTAGSSVSLVTSMLSLIFAIATIFKYRDLLKNAKIDNKLLIDLRLFIQALILFIVQLLYSSHYIMIWIATIGQIPNLQQFALAYYIWINDFFCLLNPIVLLVVSKTIRMEYFCFLFRNEYISNSVKVFSLPKRSSR